MLPCPASAPGIRGQPLLILRGYVGPAFKQGKCLLKPAFIQGNTVQTLVSNVCLHAELIGARPILIVRNTTKLF